MAHEDEDEDEQNWQRQYIHNVREFQRARAFEDNAKLRRDVAELRGMVQQILERDSTPSAPGSLDRIEALIEREIARRLSTLTALPAQPSRMRIKDWLNLFPRDGRTPASWAKHVVKEAAKLGVRLDFGSVRSRIFEPPAGPKPSPKRSAAMRRRRPIFRLVE
jgi:hypothetical protein